MFNVTRRDAFKLGGAAALMAAVSGLGFGIMQSEGCSRVSDEFGISSYNRPRVLAAMAAFTPSGGLTVDVNKLREDDLLFTNRAVRVKYSMFDERLVRDGMTFDDFFSDPEWFNEAFYVTFHGVVPVYAIEGEQWAAIPLDQTIDNGFARRVMAWVFAREDMGGRVVDSVEYDADLGLAWVPVSVFEEDNGTLTAQIVMACDVTKLPSAIVDVSVASHVDGVPSVIEDKVQFSGFDYQLIYKIADGEAAKKLSLDNVRLWVEGLDIPYFLTTDKQSYDPNTGVYIAKICPLSLTKVVIEVVSSDGVVDPVSSVLAPRVANAAQTRINIHDYYDHTFYTWGGLKYRPDLVAGATFRYLGDVLEATNLTTGLQFLEPYQTYKDTYSDYLYRFAFLFDPGPDYYAIPNTNFRAADIKNGVPSWSQPWELISVNNDGSVNARYYVTKDHYYDWLNETYYAFAELPPGAVGDASCANHFIMLPGCDITSGYTGIGSDGEHLYFSDDHSHSDVPIWWSTLHSGLENADPPAPHSCVICPVACTALHKQYYPPEYPDGPLAARMEIFGRFLEVNTSSDQPYAIMGLQTYSGMGRWGQNIQCYFKIRLLMEGNIVIKKLFKGINAFSDYEFEFTVTLTGNGLTDVNGNVIAGTAGRPISGTFGGYTFDENGKTTVRVKSGESVTIEGIPANHHVVVSENELPYYYKYTGDNGLTWDVVDGQTHVFEITNEMNIGFTYVKKNPSM